MDRRLFIQNSLFVGFLTGIGIPDSGFNQVFGSNVASETDMVAIKGGEPVEMFLRAIDEMGSMKRFVKQGQKVLIKPNIGWDRKPEQAANTNPLLIGAIVKACKEAGASQIMVFDHTCNNWEKCYENSGIKSAVVSEGGQMLPGNNETNYKPVAIEGATVLKEAKFHEALLDTDVFINVPVLKHHGSTHITAGLKNLMGVVWDRRFYHSNDLHLCIAETALHRKPDLTIIDAYNVMKTNGPRGVSMDDVVQYKTQIISTDCVAADYAAIKIFGMDVDKIHYVKHGEELGLGTTDMAKLNVKRLKMA